MKERSRIRSEELLALFGEQTTTRLICHLGGKRLPAPSDYARALRRQAVIAGWLQGYSQPDLAAKFQLSLPYVRRLVTQ